MDFTVALSISRLRSCLSKLSSRLSKQDFCLGLNFGEAQEKQEVKVSEIGQPEQDEIRERSQSEIDETLSRELKKFDPDGLFAKFASDLAKYVDFNILTVTKNPQNSQVSAIQDKQVEPKVKAEEVEAPQIQEKCSGDLSRLHSSGNNWVCICTENKTSKGERGEWQTYWTPANRVEDALATLKLKLPDFDEFNIYVSQLEFSNLDAISTTTIEHYKPKSKHHDLTLDYKNMLAVCSGGRDCGGRKNLCCDASKGDREIKISPYNRHDMDIIRYKTDGTMYTSPKDEEFEDDINNVLKLNGERDANGNMLHDTSTELVKRRREVYKNVFLKYINGLSSRNKLTPRNIENKIKELEQEDTYRECIGVLLYFLKRQLKRFD